MTVRRARDGGLSPPYRSIMPMHQGELTRNGGPPAAAGSFRFPPEDAGKSLAEIVRRDLDAALQLLTDRAQYITGASGAAIALKRNGMNDMLCRASTGENAPELGALLSTEYGLSGESVRTRQALRCDDAEQDDRVNREVCRQLGIASVVVMPVVHDDEVLGVFELFSGKANAFGERDLSAVQRLTEMVQTAVRLANAAEKLPEKLSAAEAVAKSAAARPAPAPAEENVRGEQVLGEHVLDEQVFEEQILDGQILDEEVLEIETVEAVGPPADALVGPPMQEVSGQEPVAKADAVAQPVAKAEPVANQAEVGESTAATPSETIIAATPKVEQPVQPAETLPALGSGIVAPSPEAVVAATRAPEPAAKVAESYPPKKKLFWSAALDLASEAKSAESDQSHVPPVLRGLRKCEACGFPVSAGRALCVECEEKKWRGQLRKQPVNTNPVSVASVSNSLRATGGAVATMATPAPNTPATELPANGDASRNSVVPASETSAAQTASQPAAPVTTPELVLSAAVVPHRSWISSYKYVIVALLVAAALIAIFLSR